MSKCNHCGNPASSRCAGCNQVYYCNVDHQRQDWGKHKAACKKATQEKSKSVPQSNKPNFVAPTSQSWTKGLSVREQCEWLVDCYRMRVDDTCTYQGEIVGIYAEDRTNISVVAHFFTFCKLAKLAGVIPDNWNWSHFFVKALELVPFAFEKSDAQDKYGSENYFSSFMGGRSLRATAEQIYQESIQGPLNTGGDVELEKKVKAARELEEKIANSFLSSKFFQESAFEFAEVGGATQWMDFMINLKLFERETGFGKPPKKSRKTKPRSS